MSGNRVRWSMAAVALILVGIAGAGWLLKQPSATAMPSALQPASPENAATPVEAVRVRRADVSLRAEATGYLEPWRKVEVRTEAGGRILERRGDEGSRVSAGELLVRLDDRDRVIELEEAQAEWLKTQAGYAVDFQREEARPRENASRPPTAPSAEVERVERLLQEGLLSRHEADEARRRYEADRVLSGGRREEVRAATAGLAQAEQRVARARLGLERTRILAPFAGRLADLVVEAGQQVSPGEVLFTLLEDDRLKVDVDVLEADVVRLRQGAPARVRIPSFQNLVLAGTVHTINPRVNPETGTGRVTLAIPNPKRLLLAGLFASVELETARIPARLVVPAEALLLRQGRNLVFRIEGGRAHWTYVEVGARSGDLVEIVSGLSEGDLVASGGHFALAHEAPVEPRIVAGPSRQQPAPVR